MNTRSKKSLQRSLIEWAITIAAGAVILYFWAPASWWQFGVTPVEKRTAGIDFVMERLDGNGSWRFSDHRGKVVLVNYWATWCPPCRVETPGLVGIAEEFADRGVVVVGITVDEDLSLVPPFVESYTIPYPILRLGYDPNMVNESFSLPTTLLYDKQGNLAKRYTGLVLRSTLRSDIEELLKNS
jgi:cytochrome c biogenesis protein CcmG, thiol:disulfide interchange protein DsbE